MKLYTLQEVTELFQIHEKKIRSLINNGQIPYIRIGVEYRFPEDALRQWIKDSMYKKIEVNYSKTKEE